MTEGSRRLCALCHTWNDDREHTRFCIHLDMWVCVECWAAFVDVVTRLRGYTWNGQRS